MQAGLADNPPVFILGGNILPMGPPGPNTTTALRGANLTLLVAFPSADSPPFERCGSGCSSQNGIGNRVTCGHMYLDQGSLLDCNLDAPSLGSCKVDSEKEHIR